MISVNALVTNEGGWCKVLAVNTNEENVTITINPQELIPCEYDGPYDPDSETEKECEKVTDEKQRVEQVLEFLNLDQLRSWSKYASWWKNTSPA